MKQNVSKYTHRFLARFIIELETPLALSSGKKDITTDALVALDVNGLPYLPGTSIAGVVRSIMDSHKESSLFGFQNRKNACGSEIIFTEGKILDSKQNVVDGLNINAFDDELLKEYRNLPIRQHASINSKGVTKNTGKFDEQVVYAGTRFCFEIEIVSDGTNKQAFEDVLTTIASNSFRIGGGTRNGFGKIRVEKCNVRTLDLRKADDRNLYLSKSSRLSDNWEGWNEDSKKTLENTVPSGWTEYKLSLRPDDFFYFGSGFGDVEGNVDNTTVRASKVVWSNLKGELVSECSLIPATSLKGAIRHRTAYYYNKLTGIFATPETVSDKNTDQNTAVKELFGYTDGKNMRRGNAIFSDVIKVTSKMKRKTFNHVKIDRITNAPIDGALFTDQADYMPKEEIITSILVKDSAFEQDDNIRKALELTLNDICNGLLPLGGNVNRGYGIFTGSFTSNKG